jgi:hypothetical protein
MIIDGDLQAKWDIDENKNTILELFCRETNSKMIAKLENNLNMIIEQNFTLLDISGSKNLIVK